LNAYWKIIVACIPAFATGALSPVISDLVLRIAFFLSWVCCVATFLNEDYLRRASAHVAPFIKGEYRKGVAGTGAVLWSIILVLVAVEVGALVAHVLW
jgi:hypothetical protein